MKIKGIVQIEVIDSSTQEVKEKIIKENLIPDASWVGVLSHDSISNYFGSRRISISTDTTTPTASNSIINNIIGTTYTPSGITSPIYVDSIDPFYGQIIGQIDAIGTSRTFESVALTGLASGNVQSVSTTQAYAWLKLDLPCTQGATDFLRLTYTIQFLDNIGDGFVNNNEVRRLFGKAMFTSDVWRMSHFRNSVVSPKFNINKLPVGGLFLWQGTNVWVGSTNPTNFKYNYSSSIDANTYLGYVFNSVFQGLSDNASPASLFSINKYTYLQEPFQTGFWSTSASNVPFFDLTNIGGSQGLITFAGNWSSAFPEYYEIQIISGGAVGTTTYKFRYAKHVGFSGNTYNCLREPNIYRIPDIQYVNGLHGYRNEDIDIHAIDKTRIVQYDATGISIINLLTGDFKTFDSTTTPALPVTRLLQIAIDKTNTLIYCACRNTGLYSVNYATNVVTLILGTACFGVDVGFNNIAFAIFNSSARSSSNWALPLVYTHSETMMDYTKIQFLKIDPSSSNNDICIVYNKASVGRFAILWWRQSTNTFTEGYDNLGVQPYCASVDVSDTNSFWMMFRPISSGDADSWKMTFASTTIDRVTTPFWQQFTHSIFGNLFFSKVSFYQTYYIGKNALYNNSLAAAVDIVDVSSSNVFVINIDNGIAITSAEGIINLLSNTSLFWLDYGWDGSTWVLGNTNAKTTHSSADALINGITISFTNAATAPHFIAGEKFKKGVNLGLLKDTSVATWEYRSAWYSKAIHYEEIPSTIITTTVTLAAGSDPYFRRLDTDTNTAHLFLIDGVAVTNINFDGSTPAASEVSIETSGSATIKFNSADVGKTLTGYYVWIEV